MNAVLFAIVINTLFFLADVFIKLGGKKHKTAELIYLKSIYTFALACTWLFASGAFQNSPSPLATAQFFVCSAFCIAGLFFYVRALKHMHFVNVSVIGISGALIHYVLGVLLNHENFNPVFYIAAALSIGGILIQWRKQSQHKGLWEASLSALFWGFGYALLSLPMQQSDPVWGAVIIEFTSLSVSALYLIMKVPNYPLLRPKLLDAPIILIAVFTISGTILMNIAYQKLQLSTMGFMQLSFFPYSLLAGYFLFKEKLSKLEWIGNGIMVSGMIVYFYFL